MSNPSSINRQYAIWEREMRRLRVSTRLLATALVAVLARIILAGPTAMTGLVAAVFAVLTLASLLLSHYGQRREPAQRRSRSSQRH